MKIIIIILICLFFSLTITPITESLINPITPEPQTDGPSPESPISGPAPSQSASESGGSLQTQINLLSTQIKTTNEIAIEAKNKVDEITSEIDKLKKSLTERPKD